MARTKVTGGEEIKRKMQALFARISGPMAERALTEALIIGGGRADTMTPIDTGNLLNSRFREVKRSVNGWSGRYGYTAKYAAAVHAMTGKLKGQPRADFGKTSGGTAFGGGTGVGNYWDPNAEPQWLEKGFEQAFPEMEAAVRRNMTL